MKILLIQASGYRENGRLDRRKSRWLLGMTRRCWTSWPAAAAAT
jgi:hypothetical protein